jgi:hypothetical protein
MKMSNENYNEKVDTGEGGFFKRKNRLIVIDAMYGYRLFDRKLKKNLLFNKSKEDCEKGMNLLCSGEYENFSKFKEEIKNKEVVADKIIIFNQKYGDSIYNIKTYSQLHRVALKVLEERLILKNLCKWDLPKELDFK